MRKDRKYITAELMTVKTAGARGITLGGGGRR